MICLTAWSLTVLHVQQLVLGITRETPESVNQQLAKFPGDPRNEPWERGLHSGNLELAFVLHVERGGLYVRCLWTAM